jgi:hypothetical protein
MKPHLFLAILLALAIAGCERTPRQQEIWVHFGDGPTPEYANFYEQFTKYPDYGIVEYPINEPYAPKNDLKYLRKSLGECRAAFGEAYKKKNLQYQNPLSGYDENGRERPNYRTFLPFHPRFVVFAIINHAEHKGASSFATSYKVAYIIPIELVFAEQYNFDTAVQAAYVDRAPFYFDAPSPEEERKGWSPAERYKWLAIERHEALARTKAGGAEPGGAANRSQPIHSETNQTSAAAGSGR